MIKDKIKIVFWDLDDTIWKGTLGEGDDVKIIDGIPQIIDGLNQRGIVSSICSKNDPDKARKKLEEFELWDKFVFPQISYQPKGEMIKKALSEMNLRAVNSLLIDDNPTNLRECEYYNEGMSTLDVTEVKELKTSPFLIGKPDPELTRLKQYRVLEKKQDSRKKATSNSDFLKSCHIKLSLIPYSNERFERVYELSDRTNQLNFTKNRMSRESLYECLNDPLNESKICYVTDDFGDYGVIGFYTVREGRLIHFVFSCRIMNMGIEQYVYHVIGCPKLEVSGEIASEVTSKVHCPDWITLIDNESNETEGDGVDITKILTEPSKMKVYAIGACDLFSTIANFDMPNQEVVYDCNYFRGDERAVNVGTEYIRSSYDMDDKEKEFCTSHFYNYTGEDCFKCRMFSDEYDYVIMSFHDDMVFQIFRSRTDPNLRVVRTDDTRLGETNLIDSNGNIMVRKDQLKWLEEYFYPGEYITEERFYDNLKWIEDRLPLKTRIILLTAPELDYYRQRFPHIPEVREQIKKLNRIIFRIVEENPERYSLIDMNDYIKSTDDITDYIFHLKPQTSWNLYCGIARELICHRPQDKGRMLDRVRGNRKVVLVDTGSSAEKVLYNLKLGGEQIFRIVSYDELMNDDSAVCEEYYYVLRDGRSRQIREILERKGLKPYRDYSGYCNRANKKNTENTGWGDDIDVGIKRQYHVSDKEVWKNKEWNDFFDDAKDKKLVIYATGVGLAYYLKEFGDRVEIKSVIDSDAQKAGTFVNQYLFLKNTDMTSTINHPAIKDMIVETPENLEDMDKNTTVVLIANLRYYDDIAETLIDRGFEHIYSLMQMEARRRKAVVD